MVSTRAQRPAATDVEIPPAKAPGDESSAATAVGATSDHDQATGSYRPRKKRRSPSNPLDDLEPSGKRSNPRKTPSPRLKRTAIANSNARTSHQKPDQTSTRHGPWSADGNLLNTALEGTETKDGGSPLAPQQREEDLGFSDTRHASDAAETNPDMDAVMTQIIQRGETIDNQDAGRSANAAGLANSNGTFPLRASDQLKIQSLQILENLAVQVLATFAHSSYQEILALTTDAQSEPGAAYSTLKSLFDHVKRVVYSVGEPFLSPQELGFFEPEQIDIFRKANLATFVSSIFGSQDVGFYHLNEFFLDTFVIDSGRLLKTQAGLFLDLKTQAYISAIANGERSREEILQDLFPDDMEQRLLNRRAGAKQPSPGEAEFIQRARNRKRTLLEEAITVESIAQLPEKYAWEDFLRDVSSYVTKNFAIITGCSGRKISSNHRSIGAMEADAAQQPRRLFARKPAQGPLSQEVDVAPPAANSFTPRVAQMVPPDTDDIAEKAARAAEFAMQDFSANRDTAGHAQLNNQNQPQQQSQQYPFQFEQQPAPYYTQNGFNNGSQLQPQLQQQPVDMGQAQNVYLNPTPVPYPTQSAPTSVLYERARMAATAKASPSNRRAGHPSQRRPWTQEEETALMAGLDHVKGPHWSQILALYGPGGTLNETLKDRNQVQLKDKARNLKLFFLKSSIEVPYYLQFVTGELKTRAPQAARQVEQRGNSEQQGHASAGELEGAAIDGGEAVGGAEDHGTNMEDGEGEIIDPEEYAAVHEAGGQELGASQDVHELDYSNAQRQLQQAASANDGS
ncbi:MAG: hypothetical protein LQ343_002361 [Gyalolechia ehrenbergii]|nr:MAG: hypothetical protein LQ343_002361 [Gyalolechia ehrenbergii]